LTETKATLPLYAHEYNQKAYTPIWK